MKPSNAYKNQHFLPSVYLKQFSVDGAASTSESPIWMLTSESHERVKIKKQNRVPFGYSKKDPEGAEKQFHWLENEYARFMKRVWNLQAAESPEQYFTLIWMIVSLHIRNPAYKNLSGAEAIDVYNYLEMEFVDQFLKDKKADETIDADLLDWRVRIFHSDKDLLTSDNPSLWINHGDSLRPLAVGNRKLNDQRSTHYGLRSYRKIPHRVRSLVFEIAWEAELPAQSGGRASLFIGPEERLPPRAEAPASARTWLRIRRPGGPCSAVVGAARQTIAP